MALLGDMIVLLAALAALAYALHFLLKKKVALYFKLIAGAIASHSLSYIFDVCELVTTGTLSDGFNVGYLGSIGCFLLLLTASFGYVDGILDDRTSAVRGSRLIALLAPLTALLFLVPNLLAEVPTATKVSYVLIWIPAMFSSYYNLKHVLIPDMGFGFVKAIRPFNGMALLFTAAQFLHLTVWNYGGWVGTLLTGILLGASSLGMIIMARRGVERWII